MSFPHPNVAHGAVCECTRVTIGDTCERTDERGPGERIVMLSTADVAVLAMVRATLADSERRAVSAGYRKSMREACVLLDRIMNAPRIP